jgi:hypothetical protein
MNTRVVKGHYPHFSIVGAFMIVDVVDRAIISDIRREPTPGFDEI